MRFAKAGAGAGTGTTRMVRVNLATRLDADRLAALGLDTTDHAGDSHQDVLLHSRADEQRLRSAGFTYRVVQADQLRHDAANRRREARAQARVMAARRLGPARAAQAASALPSGRASYRTLANINDELRALAQANPNLVRLFSIGTSRLGKPIQGIEIATNVGAADGRPGYVQIATHHAREWPGDEAALEFGYELINAATGRSNRPAADVDRLRQIAAEARTYVIPVLNVDGFDVTTETEGLNPDGSYVDPVDSPGSSGDQAIGSGAYKRKTCYDPDPALQAIPCILRTTNHATPDPTDAPGNYPDRGVDPNRNYGPFWGGPGTSDATADLTNAGPRPFSEPETEAFRRWSRDRNLTVVIGNHTFTGLILRPPGTGDQGPTPDEFRLRLLGDAMARQVDYISQFGYQLYDTTGTLDDYVYDALGAFAYTPEIGKEEFHPAYEDVIAEYDGPPQFDANGAPTGQNLLGLREAYIAAGLAAFNTGQYSETPPSPGGDPLAFERQRVTTGIPQTHGVLTGTAPAGRTLRLQSTIGYTTARNPNDDGVLHPVQTISEQRNLTLGLAERRLHVARAAEQPAAQRRDDAVAADLRGPRRRARAALRLRRPRPDGQPRPGMRHRRHADEPGADRARVHGPGWVPASQCDAARERPAHLVLAQGAQPGADPDPPRLDDQDPQDQDNADQAVAQQDPLLHLEREAAPRRHGRAGHLHRPVPDPGRGRPPGLAPCGDRAQAQPLRQAPAVLPRDTCKP